MPEALTPLFSKAPWWWSRPATRWLLISTLLAVAGLYGLPEWTDNPLLHERSPGPLLEQARLRGKLVVGVREYSRPSMPGAPVRREPDSVDAALAQALGRYLKVPVEMLGLASDEREAALRERQVDVLITGATEPAARTAVPVPASAVHGRGALIALRTLALPEPEALSGHSVCLAEGSPYHLPISKRGGLVRNHPSSLQAATAFMAGECDVLAEDLRLVEWLLQQPDWRFYRQLPFEVRQETGGYVQLPDTEPQTVTWLAAALRDWQRQGLQDQALGQRISDFGLDMLKLENGLVCH
ncbi:substrate-binding periplasmic protein [Azomonas macrocytogenes]|uniref:Polar amino acid transport system substrate-binding protein n=1 Tax=Azomonas macrocytogenes TaxID=69962 RepID=A0A839T839_AZOMA|nr:transporter substrate-binding domain-containing protein [Azomonas macrocytogenes]MBB3105020.1 polar amino acid transport system substrate-binding protein [Azomonas macrocytogenes]